MKHLKLLLSAMLWLATSAVMAAPRALYTPLRVQQGSVPDPEMVAAFLAGETLPERMLAPATRPMWPYGSFALANVTAYPGEEAFLDINVNTTQPVRSFQFEITLPPGVAPSYLKQIEISGRTIYQTSLLRGEMMANYDQGGISYSSSWLADSNRLLVICYATTQNAVVLQAGSGLLFSVKLQVSDDNTNVDMPITMSRVVIGDAENVLYTQADATATMTVNSALTPIDALSLEPAATEVAMGMSTQLSPMITPAAAAVGRVVAWRSDNPAVATVDAAGVVTGIAPGVATITATAAGLRATSVVTVVVRARSIDITPGDVTLALGATQRYIASVQPTEASQSITWQSSNPSVATVDGSGLVTAVGAGEATITVSTTDGTNLSASRVVTVVVPVTSLSLSSSSLALNRGVSTRLTATVSPANATNPSLRWSSSNTAVATVDQTGTVTAVGSGNAIITASTSDGTNLSATCSVAVTVAVTGITVMPENATMSAGSTLQLNAIVTPDDATNKSVTWTSSNTAVATVDANGKVSARGAGEAVIIATTADGTALTATSAITVVVPVTSITINPPSLNLRQGGSTRLNAVIKPDNATNKTVTWSSSDPSIVTVDAEGRVNAIGGGVATITATTSDGTNLTATCAVTVTIPVSSVALEPTEATLLQGRTLQLQSTVLPENASNKSLTYSTSNSSVAIVNASGLVTAVGAGETTITATTADGTNLAASCVVTVTPLATSVSLSQSSQSLNKGESFTLVATVKPDGATQAVTWKSANEAVATVDQTGTVTAVGSGNTIITASTSDGTNLSATCSVAVTVAVTGITVTPENATMSAGSTLQLNAIVTPDDATNKSVTWTSSNTAVATVDANGKVSARGAGEAVIIATTADGTALTATSVITVVVPVTSITINPPSLSLRQGGSTRLNAVIKPDNATNKTVTWSSSDPSIVTVDAEGRVNAIGGGVATITATTSDGTNLRASCSVTVTIPVSSVALEPAQATLLQGRTLQLQSTVLPENASNKSLTYSTSNSSVAIVNASGLVTAVGAGETTITATTADGTNLAASCVVTVTPLAASVSLSQSSQSLNKGESFTLVATVKPDGATQAVTWKSANEAVATVDATGRVTAMGSGSAAITATTTDGTNISATCVVTVRVPVSSLQVEPNQANLYPGQSLSLHATVLPKNATNRDLKWRSADINVATVDNSGNVTAVAGGVTVISAMTTDGTELSASCDITVAPAVSSITLSESDHTMAVGNTFTIEARVSPAGAMQSITWRSLDSAVAAVDQNGRVTAVAAGQTDIIATAGDNSGASAVCHVTVIDIDGNYLVAEPVTVVRGNEVILPIAMMNADEVTAIQADLHLTDGISVVVDEYGDPDIYLDTERKGRDHELSTNGIGIATRILISSATNRAFNGNMGTVFYIHLIADKNIDNGIYMLALRNITISTVAGARVKPADVEVEIGVEQYVHGDANGDAFVDVADYVTTANYILNKNPFPFFFTAADVHTDGVIDVADLVGITNIGMSGSAAGAPARRVARVEGEATTDYAYVEDFNIAGGQTLQLPVCLANAATYNALQFDVVLPEGLEIDSELDGGEVFYLIAPTTRCSRHTVTAKRQPDGAVRVWITSQQSRAITGNDGAVVTMSLTADDDFAGEAELRLINVVAAMENETGGAKRVELADATCRVNPAQAGDQCDVNHDGNVDVGDVNTVLEAILNANQDEALDVNGDHAVDVGDVNTILSAILSK